MPVSADNKPLDPRPIVTSTGVRYETWQRPGVITEFAPREGYSQIREDYR